MPGRNTTNDIDVFETGFAIEAKVGQVLTEESETFASIGKPVSNTSISFAVFRPGMKRSRET